MANRRPCKRLDTPALHQWLWRYWPSILREWTARAPDVSLWGFMQHGHGGRLLEFESWWRQAQFSVYSDGFDAYDQGMTEEDCPYDDVILRRMWLDGFERAREEWEDDDEAGWEATDENEM